MGIPDALIEAAAKSEPQGFLLFDDLPDQTQPATGPADQATTTQIHKTPPKPKTGGASWQVKETASRITDNRTEDSPSCKDCACD